MEKEKGHLYATIISLIIGIVSLIISTIAVFFTFTILIINIWQFRDTKRHQDWTRNEISRKPELYLEARGDEPVDSIYNKIDCKAMIFRCDLVNSGKECAKNIEIKHSRYLDSDPKLSIYISSQGKDEPIFYTPNDETADTMSFDVGKINPFMGNDTTADSTISIYVPNASTTVYFKKTDESTVLIPLYYYNRISFQENANEVKKVELHYIWLLWNMSQEIDTYCIPYTITSDEGIFEDTLKIKNPFCNNDKIQK